MPNAPELIVKICLDGSQYTGNRGRRSALPLQMQKICVEADAGDPGNILYPLALQIFRKLRQITAVGNHRVPGRPFCMFQILHKSVKSSNHSPFSRKIRLYSIP